MEVTFNLKVTVTWDEDVPHYPELPLPVWSEIMARLMYAAGTPVTFTTDRSVLPGEDPQDPYIPKEIHLVVQRLAGSERGEPGYIPVVDHGQISPVDETWGVMVSYYDPEDGANATPIDRDAFGNFYHYI